MVKLTIDQQRTLYSVNDKLSECRELLDCQMYGRENSEEGFKLLREVYDMICKIQDKL